MRSPNLRRHRKTNSRNVEIGCMVANVDIGLAGMNVFLANNFVGNKIKLTESPGPEFEKLIAYRSVFLTKKKGKKNTRKV